MNIETLKQPFVILLVGPPMSGKTTWINTNFPDIDVISRDEILMEVYGSRDYTEAFRNVDQKLVDKTYLTHLIADIGVRFLITLQTRKCSFKFLWQL